jgi:iron(III) transport system substrate-binding protein
MSRSRTFRSLAVAATTLLALTATACGGDSSDAEAPTTGDAAWDAVLAEAYEEGAVNVYNAASDQQNRRLKDAFSTEYPGIKLTITRGAAELPERVSTELDKGLDGADVLMFSDPNWFTEHADHLAEVESPSTEGWSEDWWAVDDKAISVTALPWSMIVWNTDTFPDGFKTYDDLLAPEVKGKLGTRSELTPSIAGYLDHLETEVGAEHLKGLAKQKPKFYPSAIPLIQAVASGEIGVSNLGVPSAISDLQKSGAPIDYVLAEPGFAFTHAAASFEDSQRSNAGRVFMDFLMSEEGQQAYNGDGQGGAGREGIEGALDLEGFAMLDTAKYADPAVLEEWNRKFEEYFG